MEYFESDKLMRCNPNDPNAKIYRLDFTTYCKHIERIRLKGGINYIPPFANDKDSLTVMLNDGSLLVMKSDNEIDISSGTGFGIKYVRNGNAYEGELRGFHAEGWGRWFFPNGMFQYAKYVNGKPECDWGFTAWPDARYEGGYKQGQRYGKGRMIYSNGICFEGESVYNPNSQAPK